MSKIKSMVFVFIVLVFSCIIESAIYYFLWNNVIVFLCSSLMVIDVYRAAGIWIIMTLFGKNLVTNFLLKGGLGDDNGRS